VRWAAELKPSDLGVQRNNQGITTPTPTSKTSGRKTGKAKNIKERSQREEFEKSWKVFPAAARQFCPTI